VCFSVVAVVTAPAVRADSKSPTPWSKGVPAAAQKQALQLFKEGNDFLVQQEYTEAIAKYEKALTAWDHPSIRLNMAICLINMRQLLTAWDHLQQALRFGDAPFPKPLYAQAMTYVTVLESSLADLTVRWEQPEIKVMVDGAVVLNGKSKKLLAGNHQLVASRPGYATLSRVLYLPAGKPDVEQIALELEKVTVQRDNYERRWPWWVPWGVEGGGAVLALAATGLYLNARSEMQHHDQVLGAVCPNGCMTASLSSALQAQETSARRKSGVAIGMWVGAGALVITGGVMAALNRPYKLESHAATPALAVSRDYVGAAISFALE
jgi:hypothetical protein